MAWFDRATRGCLLETSVLYPSLSIANDCLHARSDRASGPTLGGGLDALVRLGRILGSRNVPRALGAMAQDRDEPQGYGWLA
jgi:hypothetical protein